MAETILAVDKLVLMDIDERIIVVHFSFSIWFLECASAIRWSAVYVYVGQSCANVPACTEIDH